MEIDDRDDDNADSVLKTPDINFVDEGDHLEAPDHVEMPDAGVGHVSTSGHNLPSGK